MVEDLYPLRTTSNMSKDRKEYFKKYREENREMVNDISRRSMRKMRTKKKTQ